MSLIEMQMHGSYPILLNLRISGDGAQKTFNKLSSLQAISKHIQLENHCTMPTKNIQKVEATQGIYWQ